MPPECSTFKEPFQGQPSSTHELFTWYRFLSHSDTWIFWVASILKNTQIFHMKILFVQRRFFRNFFIRLSFFLHLWKRFFLMTYRIDDDDDWQGHPRGSKRVTTRTRISLSSPRKIYLHRFFFVGRRTRSIFPYVLKDDKNAGNADFVPRENVVHEGWLLKWELV